MASGERRHTAILAAILIAWPLAFARGAPADADVAAAEALARTLYHEGVPYAEARELGAADVARLIEMLDDPDEVRHRAQIVEVLGMSGGPGAYDAVARAAAAAPTGEVDGAIYRTRVAVLVALGHLARSDDRALSDLSDAAAPGRGAPAWSYRHLRGPALAALLRRSAATALAMSGRPRAKTLLRQLRSDPRTTREFGEHLEGALRLHGRVAREGAAKAFGRDAFDGAER